MKKVTKDDKPDWALVIVISLLFGIVAGIITFW